MNDKAKPTEAFYAVNGSLGWGDPEGGLWFLGVEGAVPDEGLPETIRKKYSGKAHSN